MGNILIQTRLCPQCGGTDLQAQVVVDIKQKPDGTWDFIADDMALTDEMSDPNIEVKCTNPLCGKIIDGNGNELPFSDADEAIAYFLDGRGIILEEKTEKALKEYDEEIYSEYEEWVNGFTHIPWEGVIGDCKTL